MRELLKLRLGRLRSRLDEWTTGVRALRVHQPCIRVTANNPDEVHFSENPKRLATDHELER